MSSVSNEIEIGGNLFVVSPLTAMRSFTLQPRIAPVVAEAAAIFLGTLRGAMHTGIGGTSSMEAIASFLASDIDLGQLAGGIGSVFAKLPPAEMEWIVRELLAGATMDGTPLFTESGSPFEIKMRGRTLDTWKLLWHAIRVNYPDFFQALGGSASAPGASRSVGSTT